MRLLMKNLVCVVLWMEWLISNGNVEELSRIQCSLTRIFTNHAIQEKPRLVSLVPQRLKFTLSWTQSYGHKTELVIDPPSIPTRVC